MTSHPTSTDTAPAPLILDQDDASRRSALLAELQTALAGHRVRSVLARNHRLVLRSDDSPYQPSGPTQPELHISTPHGTLTATTDGQHYHLPGGQDYPAADMPAAVAAVTNHRTAQPA
jgi:hypothetical protein